MMQPQSTLFRGPNEHVGPLKKDQCALTPKICPLRKALRRGEVEQVARVIETALRRLPHQPPACSPEERSESRERPRELRCLACVVFAHDAPRTPPLPRAAGEIAYGSLLGGGNARAACSNLSPRAGRGRFASGALAKRSKSGEGACRQAQTRGDAPPPRFLLSPSLRSGSDLSPPAGGGGASGVASHFKIPTTKRLFSRTAGRWSKWHARREAATASPAPATRRTPRRPRLART